MVQEQLEKVEGVQKARVSFETGTAKVIMVKGTDPQKLVAALEEPYSGKIKP